MSTSQGQGAGWVSPELWDFGNNYLQWPPLAVMSTILDSTYPVTSNYYHCFSTTHVCHCLRIKYSHFLHTFFPYACLSQSCWKHSAGHPRPLFSPYLWAPSCLPLFLSCLASTKHHCHLSLAGMVTCPTSLFLDSVPPGNTPATDGAKHSFLRTDIWAV